MSLAANSVISITSRVECYVTPKESFK